MKAIQIKYLGATNSKPSRLKAWTEAGTIVESLDYSINLWTQARNIADRYATERQWPQVSGFGVLPNGDYVATMG
jgi:hypothetical protein